MIFSTFKNKTLFLKLLFLISITLITKNSNAQDQELKFATLAIPGTPSPTAASLGQYANYIVSGFTGAPSINIPIYEINEDGYKLPLSLSYNPTGIKVSDVASWVGLGWSLNCGGIITRNVMDVADDRSFTDQGWLGYNYIVPSSNFDNNQRPVGYSPEAGQKNVVGLYELRQVGYDTEPDIYYFNFNGHTGKFIFNQGSDTTKHTGQIPPDQHTINLIPYQDLKFSYSIVPPLTGSRGTLGSFTVVDETGNIYYFDKRETTVEKSGTTGFPAPSIVGEYNGGYDAVSSYTSAWYLSKIKTIKNKEINFTYIAETYNQRFPETYSVRNFPASSTNVSNIDCSKKYDVLNTNRSLHENRVDGLRLSTIESTDFKVVFDAGEARQDLASASALTMVSVYSKNSTGILSFIKKFKLDYSYIQSSVDPNLNNNTDYGDPNKRLRLDRVTEINESGTTLNPYVFEYDNTYTLPGKLSPHQDFWGYFNNNTCNTLTPTVYIYPEEFGNDRFSMYRKSNYGGLEFIINGADRTTNSSAILAGTLKKITFPLGGYEEFKFASNVFYFEGRNILGGGLRLERSTRYDGINHLRDIFHEYSYNKTSDPQKSSGVLFNLPVFTYTENFLPYWNPSNPSQVLPRASGEFDPETFIYYTYNLVITSAPNYTLSGYDGVNVAYSEITEHTPGNGYITSQYSTPGRALANNDNLNGGYCDPAQDGYCDGYFKTAPVQSYFVNENCPNGSPDPNYKIDTTGLEFTGNGYPFAPKTNYDWNRGLLLSQKHFSEQNKLVNELTNEYTIYTPNKKWPLYIYGLRKSRMSNYRPYTSNCYGQTYGFIRFDVVAQYPLITNIAKVLKKTTSTIYSSANIDGTESATEYKYNGNHILESERVITTGSNEKITSRFFYPTDYNLNDNATVTDSLTGGIVNLRKKHIVNQVIQSYIEKRDINGSQAQIIDGKFIEFRSDIPFPRKSYNIESVSLINGSGQIVVNNNIVSRPSFYKYKAQYKFSDNGKLLQYQTAGSPTSYQWDYNNQFPVAEAKNAQSDEMMYYGFEEPGGWDALLSAYDTNFKHSGLASGRIDNTAATERYCLYNNWLNISLGSPKSYHYSGWVYSNGPTVDIFLFMKRAGETGYSSYVDHSFTDVRGKWVYVEKDFMVPADVKQLSLRIDNNGTANGGSQVWFDDLRLCPTDAQMTTYTFDPLVGMTSSMDSKGEPTYYEYDGFQRLISVKDKDGKIIRQTDYHYHGQ